MADKADRQQDEWSQSVSQFRDAIEHNLTASRLLTTGAIALGAAATAYLWDPQRRNAFLENSKRFSEDMTGWWSGLHSGSGRGSSRTSGDGNS
jgi:hypothetical protein